jgi:hypothetical protein
MSTPIFRSFLYARVFAGTIGTIRLPAAPAPAASGTTPQAVVADPSAVRINAAETHSLAVKADGSVWGWG